MDPLQRRVRRPVLRAGQVLRQHDGDAALRGEPVRRGLVHPAQLHRPRGDGQGGRHRRDVAASGPRAEGRRDRAAGGRRRGRAHRPHLRQLAEDPFRARDHVRQLRLIHLLCWFLISISRLLFFSLLRGSRKKILIGVSAVMLVLLFLGFGEKETAPTCFIA